MSNPDSSSKGRKGLNMEKIELGTPDGAAENIDRLAELFPQVITEVENPAGGGYS